MSPIGKFVATLRHRLFERRIEREIHEKVFPHLREEADHGYPFKTHDGVIQEQIRGHLTAHEMLHRIDEATAEMPDLYSDAFRYIVYRDLNQMMEKYVKLAKASDHNTDYKPRPALTAA